MSFVTIMESDSLCYYDTNSLGGSLPTNVTIDLCGSFRWVVTITQHESLSQLLQTNYMDLFPRLLLSSNLDLSSTLLLSDYMDLRVLIFFTIQCKNLSKLINNCTAMQKLISSF